MCIVDLSVGNERRAILVETSNYCLIGPDKGCLTLIAQKDGFKRVFNISNSQYSLSEISSTFHCRDVFASVSAYLSLGYSPDMLVSQLSISEIKYVELPKPILDMRRYLIVFYMSIFWKHNERY